MNAPPVAIGSSSVPRKVDRIASRTIDGKAVLIVLDAHLIHTLNAVGTRVFELCDGTRDVAAIAAKIAAQFEVDVRTAEQDTISFLAELAERGAIQVLKRGDRA